jgi:hypothetical protein
VGAVSKCGRAAPDIAILAAQAISADPAARTAADKALTDLAYAGDIEAQRKLIELMGRLWVAGAYDDLEYALRAEAIARLAADADPVAQRQLIALLILKGHALRAADPLEADCAQGEALAMVNALADAGDEVAAAHLISMSSDLPASAYVAAAAMSAPSLMIAPETLAPLPPLTRLERVKFWFSDRWWDLRFAWWDVCDWFAGLRGR